MSFVSWFDSVGGRKGAFLRALMLSALVTAVLAAVPGDAGAKIRVVATIPDLGSIASAVGGDQVEVSAIARPTLDIHRVEVLPSYMVRVSKADLFLKVGLGLDQWADPILDGSHNARITVIDCSQGITPLEKPTGRVDASMGDIHPNGNPHYWLDPRNGAVVAGTLARAFGQKDPGHAADFRSRAEAFARQCEAAAERGRQAVAAKGIEEILTYHRSWSYLADAFGFQVAEQVEPLPGIPPTGKHLQELVTLIQQHRIPLLIVEPYFSDDAGKFLARETGITVVKVSPSCSDVSAGSYLAHFDQIISVLNGVRTS